MLSKFKRCCCRSSDSSDSIPPLLRRPFKTFRGQNTFMDNHEGGRPFSETSTTNSDYVYLAVPDPSSFVEDADVAGPLLDAAGDVLVHVSSSSSGDEDGVKGKRTISPLPPSQLLRAYRQVLNHFWLSPFYVKS